jgi:thiamine-phosphate diphosphorylase
VKVVRECFPKMLIGASTHEPQELANTAAAGADYAIYGPVFATPGKVPCGIDRLASACREAGEFPVIAIGGMDETNFKDVLNAGAAGFAAIRSLNDPERLRSITSNILK